VGRIKYFEPGGSAFVAFEDKSTLSCKMNDLLPFSISVGELLLAQRSDMELFEEATVLEIMTAETVSVEFHLDGVVKNVRHANLSITQSSPSNQERTGLVKENARAGFTRSID
jgi:hypothetical protein